MSPSPRIGRRSVSIRLDARFMLASLLLAAAAVALLSSPARSATQTVDVGNFFFGDGTITATVGDQLRFTVSSGNNHTVEITELGISSGDLDKDDTYTTPVLTAPGTYRIWCATHTTQGHEATLTVVAAPTTTTTVAITTTTTIVPTTTTTIPGGTTTTTQPGTTTTTVPGATTTTVPGATTTAPPPGGTTLPPSESTTSSTVGATGPTDGGDETPSTTAGSGTESAESADTSGDAQAVGPGSPAIDDAAWLRPLWWAVLAASVLGLVWVGVAWRRRPTEYD